MMGNVVVTTETMSVEGKSSFPIDQVFGRICWTNIQLNSKKW